MAVIPDRVVSPGTGVLHWGVASFPSCAAGAVNPGRVVRPGTRIGTGALNFPHGGAAVAVIPGRVVSPSVWYAGRQVSGMAAASWAMAVVCRCWLFDV